MKCCEQNHQKGGGRAGTGAPFLSSAASVRKLCCKILTVAVTLPDSVVCLGFSCWTLASKDRLIMCLCGFDL